MQLWRHLSIRYWWMKTTTNDLQYTKHRGHCSLVPKVYDDCEISRENDFVTALSSPIYRLAYYVFQQYKNTAKAMVKNENTNQNPHTSYARKYLIPTFRYSFPCLLSEGVPLQKLEQVQTSIISITNNSYFGGRFRIGVSDEKNFWWYGKFVTGIV